MENFSEILDEVEKGQKIIYNNNKVTYREKGYIKITIGGVLCLLLYMVMSQNVFTIQMFKMKNTYESEWMESSLAKEMIKDIDKLLRKQSELV